MSSSLSLHLCRRISWSHHRPPLRQYHGMFEIRTAQESIGRSVSQAQMEQLGCTVKRCRWGRWLSPFAGRRRVIHRFSVADGPPHCSTAATSTPAASIGRRRFRWAGRQPAAGLWRAIVLAHVVAYLFSLSVGVQAGLSVLIHCFSRRTTVVQTPAHKSRSAPYPAKKHKFGKQSLRLFHIYRKSHTCWWTDESHSWCRFIWPEFCISRSKVQTGNQSSICSDVSSNIFCFATFTRVAIPPN